jgi:glyoxylase-like metal-dependent hydrolase (beta-lactamase superfamily II)
MMSEHKGIFTDDRVLDYLSVEPKMQADKLSDRMWTVSDGRCRTIFLEGKSGIVAFDTFGTPGRARAYAKAIAQAVPKKPIKTLIYTHDHLDHAGFGADLAPDAEVVADEMTAKVIALRQADGQTPVTRALSGKQNDVSFDGVSFLLVNPGPTHGTGNLSAYFADERLLFSSDTVLTNARYGLLPDYHIWNFVRFMRELAELDFDTFVPGRYQVGDRKQFQRGADYIEAIQESAQQAFAEMVPVWILPAITEYVKAKLGDRFGDLDGFEQQVGLSAFRIAHHYLMGGWSLEDTPTPGILLADQVG